MTDSEFKVIYKEELLKYIDEILVKLESFSSLPYHKLLDKSIDFSGNISYKENILVSEIMVKYKLDLNTPTFQNSVLVDLNKYLYLSCFDILPETNLYYNEKSNIILKKAYLRDFPDSPSAD
jgi:hypothetical protein